MFTENADKTSLIGDAKVVPFLVPANKSPIALCVLLSKITDPESPSLQNFDLMPLDTKPFISN